MTTQPRRLLWFGWHSAIAFGFLLGWLGAIFPIPGLSMAYSAIAFVATWLSLVWTFRYPRGQAAQPETRANQVLIGGMWFCGFVFVASFVTFVIATRGWGVPGDSLPIASIRQTYFLTNHGQEHAITRTRFLVAGVAALSSWHAIGVGTLCLSAFRTRRQFIQEHA